MALIGEYEPSPSAFVRSQVAEYEESGGTRGNLVPGTDYPVVIVTYRGAKSGKIRKTALMRVESDGCYALIASNSASPAHPAWYLSITVEPNVMIQDGPEPGDFRARELTGSERDTWWARSVAAYPTYADYQLQTSRLIPVLIAEPA